MQNNKKAFTLVELIVVIIILSILGTIAFISFQGYSKTSRDSVRISDIGLIKKSLEIFYIDAGKYPLTTNGYDVTYGGGKVWNQGIFGEQTFNNVSRLDKIPRDPLTDNEYTYSLLNNRQEYQLAGIIESGLISKNTIITNETFATEEIISVMVTGNYNGEMVDVDKSGTMCVVAMPSIITSSGTTIETIIPNNYLVYDNYKNLPSNYNISTKFKLLGETNLKLVNESNMDLYCGDYSQLNTNESLRIDFIDNLQKAYTGTKVEAEGIIREVLELTIDKTNPAPDLKIYTIDLVEEIFTTTISDEQKMSASECNPNYHDEGGVCISNVGVCTITNGTGINTWNGTSWDCAVDTCTTDYYNLGNNACTSVGTGYYSSSTSTTRTACSNYPDTASRNYTYTSDGNGTNSCSATYTALCGVDKYETSNGVCSNVGTGYYSANLNNGRTSCSNYPDTASRNYTYTSDGNGTNSCSATYTALCGVDKYETSNGVCSDVGTGRYSPNTNNTRYSCSNKPSYSSYTGDGNGSNSCPWSCDSGYAQIGNSCVVSRYTGSARHSTTCSSITIDGVGYIGTINCGSWDSVNHSCKISFIAGKLGFTYGTVVSQSGARGIPVTNACGSDYGTYFTIDLY